jgi:hypothetical protein
MARAKSAPRLPFVNIGGLQTSPGKEGFKPGACSRLKNLRPVAPNKLRGIARYTNVAQGGANGATVLRVAELANGKSIAIQQAGGLHRSFGNNTTAYEYVLPGYISDADLFFANSIFPTIARKRVLLNSKSGVLVSDYLDPDFTIVAQRTYRSAGLPQPAIVSITESTGSSIPDDTIVSYLAVIRREYSDGYVLTSPPSPVIRRLNDSGATADNTVRVQWGFFDDVQVGDVLELYRSNGAPATSYSDSADTGSDCFRVSFKTLDSTDVTNQYVDIKDLQLMTAPLYETYGVAAYTNLDSTVENNQPPIAAAMCTWQTFTFYSAVTEDPIILLDPRAPVGGNLTTPWERLNGIGSRSGVSNPVGPGDTSIIGVSAANMVGIKVGQRWADDIVFPPGTYVTSVGASSFTLSAAAVTPAAGFSVVDAVVVDGVSYRCGYWFELLSGLGKAGKYEVHASATLPGELTSTSESGVSITIRPIRHQATMTVKVTNAQNYNGALVEYTGSAQLVQRTTQGNLLRFSKSNQPEAVPYVNEIRCGLGEITCILATTGYVYICCTDGLYWLTGSEGNFRVEPIDQNQIVASPAAASVMGERVYAATNFGFVSFDSSGVLPLSRGVVEDLIPGQAYDASSSTPFVQCNPSSEEVWILYSGVGAVESTVYLYSSRYAMFSQLSLTGTDAYVKTLSLTLGTTASLPVVSCGVYVVGAAPIYARFDNNGTPLPIDLLMREAADPTTVKQWIDMSLVVDLQSAGETVRSSFNAATSVGTATTVAARVDARASFGIPRSEAIRPQLAAGFTVSAPNRLIDVLGLSFRVVPETTQSEVR